MRPAIELPIHPFDALLRVVLRVGEEVISFTTAERFHHAVVAPSLGVVKIIADQAGKLGKAGIVHRRALVGQVLALAPIRQRIGVIEAGRPFPELIMVEKRDHRPFEMVGQLRKLFDECRVCTSSFAKCHAASSRIA